MTGQRNRWKSITRQSLYYRHEIQKNYESMNIMFELLHSWGKEKYHSLKGDVYHGRRKKRTI